MINPDDWVSMTFDPKLQVSVKELQQALLGNRRLTAEQWEDAKECAADVLGQFLEVRRGLVLCNERLAKAYEDASQYQLQAADLGARIMRMLDDGK